MPEEYENIPSANSTSENTAPTLDTAINSGNTARYDDMVRIALLFGGGINVILAMALRNSSLGSYVAPFIGGHENQVILEHLLWGSGICGSIAVILEDIHPCAYPLFALGWIGLHVDYEYYQAVERGFYQFGQSAADIFSAIIPPIALKLFPQQNSIRRSSR